MPRPASFVGFAVLCTLAWGGCDLDSVGVPLQAKTLYYPTTLAITPALNGQESKFLYVASSDFDLRYNSGGLLGFDLEALEAQLRAGCPGNDVDAGANRCDYPNLESADFLIPNGEVRIGAYATSMSVSADGARLYVAVRSPGNVTWLDIQPSGALDCGNRNGTNEGPPFCDDAHRSGDESLANERLVTIPRDPVRLYVGELSRLFPEGFVPAGGEDGGTPTARVPAEGSYVLVAHRAGQVALMLDPKIGGARSRPRLIHIATGFAPGLAGLDVEPRSGLAYLTSSASSEVGRAGIAADPTRPSRSYVFNAGSLRLRGLDTGGDTRDVVFLGDSQRALLASRSPEAAVVVDLTRTTLLAGEFPVTRTVPVGRGPTRVVVAHLADAAGAIHNYAVVTCFDSREIYVFDADTAEEAAVIPGFTGPQEAVVDDLRKFLYVVDFRNSTLRVVDLAPLVDGLPSTSPSIISTLARPRAKSELR